MIVAVDIVDCKYTIGALGQVANGKLAQLICAGDTVERQGCQRGIGKIGINAHQHTLCRFEILGLKHHSRYPEGVDIVAGRKVERKAVEDIAFVQVLDCVGKVDCVCCIGAESVAEIHGQVLTVGANLWRCFLGRRHNYLVESVFELYIFVESHSHPGAGYVSCTGGGVRSHELGRGFIAHTAFGATHIGACSQQTRSHSP